MVVLTLRVRKRHSNLNYFYNNRGLTFEVNPLLFFLGGGVGGMGDIGDIGDMGDVGDIGDIGDMGDIGNVGGLGIITPKTPKIPITPTKKMRPSKGRIFLFLFPSLRASLDAWQSFYRRIILAIGRR